MDGIRIGLRNHVTNSYNNNNKTNLRTPSVHRSDEFKVSLRGWLYRLEGAAIKQWKRRWFVLADYCLFYYKDMTEEKMLGSLLIPSYKISPCFSKDGISRKYSFKVEHHNMKTYYFAADSKELQQKWMNVLSMASIMQLNVIFASEISGNNHSNSDKINEKELSKFEDNRIQQHHQTPTNQINDDESGFIAYQQTKNCIANNNNNNDIMSNFIQQQQQQQPSIYNNNLFDQNQQPQQQFYNGDSIGLPLYFTMNNSSHHDNHQSFVHNLPLYSPSNNHLSSNVHQCLGPPKPQRSNNYLLYDLMLYHHHQQQQQQRSFYDQNGTMIDINFIHPQQQQQQNYYSLNVPYFDAIADPTQQQMNYISSKIEPQAQRLPPRPHSADFLERNQNFELNNRKNNDDLDLECQTLFTTSTTAAQNNNNKTGEIFNNNSSQQEPVMMPIRPKSSIDHRNGCHSLFNTDDYQPEMLNQVYQPILLPSIAPNHPPLPQEYLNRFQKQQRNLIGLPMMLDKTIDYSSDDELLANSQLIIQKQQEPNLKQCETHYDDSNAPTQRKQTLELSREEYQKASRLLFERQMNYLRASTGNRMFNSNNHSNQSNKLKINHDDWNEIGLPKIRLSNGNNQCNETNESENEIKFKLGLNVRTYRKPKKVSNDDNKSNDNDKNIDDTQQQQQQQQSSNAAAPYYYSDLLNEEQKIALQKKLGDFAQPPPLLSRCTSVNSTKYLGTTSLDKKFLSNKNKSKTSDSNVDGSNQTIDPDQESSVKNESVRNNDDDQDPSLSNQISETIVESKNVKNHQKSKSKNRSLKIHTNNKKLKDPEENLDSSNESTSVDQAKTSKTKKRRKRKSKEILNASDSEIQNETFTTFHDGYRKFKANSLDHRHWRSRNKYPHSNNYYSNKFASKKFSASATELVGKSHEELILILIRLRRKQSQMVKTCEQLQLQMDSEAKMMEFEPFRRLDYEINYNQLKQKWYEINRELQLQIPIIQSIDHMIKIKSKRKLNELNKKKAASTSVLDRCTINDDDHSDSDAISSDGSDSLGTRDATTKHTTNETQGDNDNEQSSNQRTSNENIEILRQQQLLLENELDRVRGMLTHSTRKLEEKAVENAQMEQQMLMARNKLKQVLETEQESMERTRSTKLEAELMHINKIIDNLHNRRNQLNNAIENLKISTSSSSSESTNRTKTQNNTGEHQYKHYTNDELKMALDNAAETNLYPLYENIMEAKEFLYDRNGQINDRNDGSSSSSPSDRKDNETVDNLNDEYFTLNIDLDGKSSEINDNQINNNSNNSMSEFDPSKVMMIYSGDSIVDQQLKQIFNYHHQIQQINQQSSNKSATNEVKTVREVKRESERRKFNSHQRSLSLSASATASSTITAYQAMNYDHCSNVNHTNYNYFNDRDDDDILDDLKTLNQQFSKFDIDHEEATNGDRNFNAPDIVQSTIKLIDKS